MAARCTDMMRASRMYVLLHVTGMALSQSIYRAVILLTLGCEQALVVVIVVVMVVIAVVILTSVVVV